MQNQIATTNSNQITHSGKIFFTTEKDSNYAITTSFNVTYVVEYDQARNIMHSIFNTDADFITVNQTVLNRRYVQSIEPTKERTTNQKLEIEQKEMERKKEQKRKEDLLQLKRASDTKFYNEKYGEGQWTFLKSKLSQNSSQRVIDANDIKEAWVYFQTAFPSESKEVKQMKN